MTPGIARITVLALLGAASMVLAVSVGSVELAWSELMSALWGDARGTAGTVIWELRLPRALTAFGAGAMLALAGALMQVLLRNPLADPYILGISGGAAVAALGAMLLGVSAGWRSGAAFAGAVVSMFLVFGVAHGRGGWTPTRLLLTGVVLATGWSAIISFLLAVSPNRSLRGMLFWLMGDLSHAEPAWWAWAVLALCLAVALAVARSLNLLARGELQAGALGVNVAPLRLVLYFVASLLTATAVTLAGTVGFVGLVVPHMLRLIGGGDHRWLLPATVLLGGSLLVLADTLARQLLAPQQLPVGVVTALLGVPVFLFLLQRGPRSHQL